MKSVRQAGFISLTALSILVGSSFVLITSLQAGPLSRCQQSLARFASSSIVKKIKEMRAQLMIQISKNQDEAFSELKDQTLKPKPWLYAKTALETLLFFGQVFTVFLDYALLVLKDSEGMPMAHKFPVQLLHIPYA